jgi:hypothetical protein
VNLTERDRKIVIFLAPLVVIIAYWFLLLGPKRDEASKAADQLAKQEQKRDKAQQAVTAAEASKASFAKDYTTLVKLGKAVPTQVDMPTLIVQLEAAAKGTGTEFFKIATGQRTPGATAAPAAQPPAPPGEGNGSQPAAAGGAPAASAPGGAVESAGNAVTGANTKAAGSEGAGTQTSTSSGGAPAAGGAGAAPGLETVPLDLEFHARFFSLADFFHRLKRFVDVVNDRVHVRGRLLTVESLSFKSDPELFPRLIAEVKATVYLTPAGEGVTAGATPQGPATPAAAGTSAPGAAPTPAPAPSPTATATP